MDADQLTEFRCAVRVMAMTVAISARLEGMKAANAERKSNGYANAYDDAAFCEVESELANLVRAEIGL